MCQVCSNAKEQKCSFQFGSLGGQKKLMAHSQVVKPLYLDLIVFDLNIDCNNSGPTAYIFIALHPIFFI